MSEVGERRKKRRHFLDAIYDLSGGSTNQFVYWPSVAPRLGWDAENPDHLDEALGIADYLANAGLITIMVDEGTIYRITVAGIDEVENQEPHEPAVIPSATESAASVQEAPLYIRDSLRQFREDHPDPSATAFILMDFDDSPAHTEISDVIKRALADHGITGVRADDKDYHDDLWPNVLTYMHGCSMGVAVYERIEAEDFNPNVSLEVGYMLALLKPLCLLKDRTLRSLHADLVGRLYRELDSRNPADTIPPQLARWLSDRRLSSA